MKDNCPICLTDKNLEKICYNNHYACKVCMILSVINKQYYCPMCRSDIYLNKFQLSNLDIPYDFNKKRIYYRINDTAPWKPYDFFISKNILININYSIILEQYYGILEISNSIKIYWGNEVNESIFNKNKKKLYKKHKTELSRWKGVHKNIIIEYNYDKNTLRLCAII